MVDPQNMSGTGKMLGRRPSSRHIKMDDRLSKWNTRTFIRKFHSSVRHVNREIFRSKGGRQLLWKLGFPFYLEKYGDPVFKVQLYHMGSTHNSIAVFSKASRIAR